MRSRFVLVVTCLWIATNSQSENGSSITVCQSRCNVMCGPSLQTLTMYRDYNTTTYCYQHLQNKLNCNSSNFEIELDCTDYDSNGRPKCTPNYDIPTSTSKQNTPGTTAEYHNMAMTTESQANTRYCTPSNSITVVVLGVLVGLLAILFTLATIGWIWTYLVIRKRGERINIRNRSSADDLRLNNPTYSGDDILQLQPPVLAPTYETIQPNPTDGDKLVLTQQGDSEYNVLNRNQNTSTKSATILETIHEYDIEDSYSKLERTATSNGSRELVNDGDYSNLETLAIESTTTGQAAQRITASEEGEMMNDKARMDENVMEEASTEEGATQLENEVAQKVGEDEGEQGGEQQVLLLVTTTTDTRKFGNGSDNEESDDLSMTTNPSYNTMRM